MASRSEISDFFRATRALDKSGRIWGVSDVFSAPVGSPTAGSPNFAFRLDETQIGPFFRAGRAGRISPFPLISGRAGRAGRGRPGGPGRPAGAGGARKHRGPGGTNPTKILNFVTAGGSFFSIIKRWAPAGYKSLHSPVSSGRIPHQKLVTNWLQTGPKRLQTVPESYVLLEK